MKNSTFIKIFLGVVAVVAIVGGYYFPKFVSLPTASPAGSTFLTAKFAGVAINLANPGTNGTSTSILNTDANDRLVTGFRIGCNGVGTSKTAVTGTGLANLQVNIGTTTTAAPTSFTSFASVTGSSFNVGTSTAVLVVASSTTQTATSSLAGLWPTNTYMTFYFNATNTAACTVGVDYVAS